ncbi:serine/threonine protein kinase [Slackia faecicanis]|uniref:Serine/threonine protein kinase n=1 Tax=Slackia faecicanis TaxID=255723 RepID=A0A3N0AI20_9ACTN|nr:DEAD/DEAH box helicase [Slackia faecicanis]MDO5357915.1 DEAD/DEAH box helicase [Slackia faecicanis]RNL21431.1 serine/threonine protein kinase [Slackia faecicanis]
MISEQELACHCAPKTLQRARQIASSEQNILTKKCRYDRSGTHLSAFVASSHGWNDCYRSSISFDEDADRVIDYACTCPAYLQYDGPCKHSLALALSYNRRPAGFMGYKAHRKPETTACLADLIRRADAAEKAVEVSGIDIEPTFVYGYRSWAVQFKVVGPDGAYVMKDVGAFVDDVQRGAWRSYGKKLAFTHALDAFTAHGRAMAELIDRAVCARRRAATGIRGSEASGRVLDLNEFELIDFLDACQDASFLVEGADYGVRSRTVAHVECCDPRIEVNMTWEDGGISIASPCEAVAISHGGRLYLWQDETFYRCSEKLAGCAAFLHMLHSADSDELFVSEDDLALFCSAILPRIERSLQVSAPEKLDAWRPVEGTLEFYFDKIDAAVTCEAVVKYGASRRALTMEGPRWEGDDAQARPLPDEKLERAAYALMHAYFDDAAPRKASADDRARCHFLSLERPQSVADLLFSGMARFAEQGSVYTTDAFDRLVSDKKPRISVGISLAGDLIDLDVHATDLDRDELAALLGSYRARKRYHRLKSGAFLDMADFELAQLDKLARDLDLTPAALTAGTVELPAYRAVYLDETLDDARRDAAFETYVQKLRGAKTVERAVPETLANTLRPYQREGFSWMNSLADLGFGGILADEMGLGKSLQLISFLLARRDEARAIGPSLVVCPASLVYNWTAEFERFAPELNVRAVAGTKQERIAARAEDAVDVFVTSYDLARIDVKDYAARDFYCCALDEAQYIKNHGTLTARAVKRVRAKLRFALTGTPMENRLSEIWSIFDFLMPGLLGSYMRFRERFELDIIGGNDDAAARLQALVGPFMLRRLKADVLDDLPDKIESAVHVPMTRKQEKLYLAYEQQLRESLAAQRALRKSKDGEAKGPGVEVLAELTRLRQICCDPRLAMQDYPEPGAKIAAIVDLLESAENDGQKTLVFSQFTSFLTLIADELDKLGMPYYTITGATPKKERIDLVDAFNADDTPVFLVSLKAGGTGLNLTGASVVIHADPWWNAAAQAQATDRAHRIGQTRCVNVHQVIAKGTIEERIVALQQAKSDLADKVIGANAASSLKLTGDELLELLQG